LMYKILEQALSKIVIVLKGIMDLMVNSLLSISPSFSLPPFPRSYYRNVCGMPRLVYMCRRGYFWMLDKREYRFACPGHMRHVSSIFLPLIA
jgi:hypothetical protein